MYVEVIASQSRVVFWDTVYVLAWPILYCDLMQSEFQLWTYSSPEHSEPLLYSTTATTMLNCVALFYRLSFVRLFVIASRGPAYCEPQH